MSAVTAGVSPVATQESLRHDERRQGVVVNAWRVAIVGGFLLLWEYIPKIPGIADRVVWIDPFFISAPSRVAERLWEVTTGSGTGVLIWGALWFTVWTALVGMAIAVVLGAVAGLLLSNSATAERVFRPLVAALNAVPRIAIVPIVVIIARSAAGADITTAVAVVIGLVFYQALEGGRSVPQAMLDSARLMGASERDVMLRVRSPYVLAWVFAAMPSAFALALVGSVTTELFTGAPGIGHQLQVAVNTADATLTFTVVVLLTIVGVFLVQGSGWLRAKVVPWWNA
jgi:NitT/TauT family transport system permease protein